MGIELTSEEKKAYIQSKGWTTLWHNNYWVHSGIMAGANLDYCGIDLESAYKCQLKHEQQN
ncbi:hypothetical protein MA9V1_158 [Chryseobacterium phage MA9V-1]|nr:hypothetical protein MA9V1_158 [Chryseobacterium phage MA9V-1]